MFGFILNLFKHKAPAPSAKVAVKSLPTRMVGGIHELPVESFKLDKSGLYKSTVWAKRVIAGEIQSTCYNIYSESVPSRSGQVRLWNPGTPQPLADDPNKMFSDCAEATILNRLPGAISIRIV